MANAIPLLPFFPGENTVSQPQLQFTPYGGNSNKMIIEKVNNGSSGSIYRISGTTGNQSSGFTSQQLNYAGKYISLSLGNIFKKSNPPHDNYTVQLSFNFHILTNNHYLDFSLVHGPIYNIGAGWTGTHFYKTIAQHSQYTMNLNGSALKNIYVSVQEHSTVGPVDFGVGFH